MSKIARRDFLKAAPAVAASAAALEAAGGRPVRARAAVPAPKIGSTAYTPVDDYPIQPRRHWHVALTDGFWKPKVTRNAEVTIPLEVRKLNERPQGFTGNVLEAAILSLKAHPDPWLQQQVDARIQEIAASPSRGNSGFEVAAAYYHTTGRPSLLDQAIQMASALYDDFAVRNPPFSGGERDAINCVQLYRATHDKRHLDLAKHYLDIRGLETSVNRSRHNQSYKPVLEQSEAVGHAVNCVSLMVSLADVGVLTGIPAYFEAAKRMWSDVVSRKLYITGGVGATGNEGFGEPYSLPNIDAYSETCAVLMFITLNHRMFMATGDAKYIDVLERGMYNNAIDGVSASGTRFFYVNRLASAGDGRDARWERASLECCPPNLVRFLAAMPGYVYAQDARAVYVNLYVSSEASFPVHGKELTLSVQSEMPWGGKSTVVVAAREPVRGSIKLRIPGWARDQAVPASLYAYTDRLTRKPTVTLNGTAVNAVPDPAGYVTIDRAWTAGDRIELDFPVEVRRVIADTRVVQNRRKMAIERGPVVYCAEAPDVEGGRVLDLLFDPSVKLTARFDPSLYGGATVLEGAARSLANPAAPARRVRLIPYYLWANRAPGEMAVWMSTAGYAIGDTGPAGGFIFYENPNHATDGWRYLEAAPFDQSAGTTWGCFRREIAGARGAAVGTGRQNTLDMMAACTERGSAADLCANLHINGVRGWFLPSRDELMLLYRNLKAAGLGDFRDGGAADNFTYWASTQDTADMAAHVDFADLGRLHGDDKDFPRRVRAVRAF